MTSERLEQLEKQGIIKYISGGEYRLKRPLTVLIHSTVINNLIDIYRSNYEEGGILEGTVVDNGEILITEFHPVKNKAVNSYSYTPNTAEWERTIKTITDKGNLPFAVHTHPTQLGFSSYDSKREMFYIKPSRPDINIARDGITPYFKFPECIFVADNRYKNGFALNFFTGYIFPKSIYALTGMQLFSGSAAVLAVYAKKYGIAALLTGLYFREEFRRPKYTVDLDGSYRISLSY